MDNNITEKHHNVKAQVDLEALARCSRTNIAQVTKNVKFTDEKKIEFLDLLRTNSNISVSARSVGISPSTVNAHRLRDPNFDKACQEALEEATDYMEAEAIRRAIKGVDKTIYYQGVPIGTETIYSDSLLLRLLEANRPEKWSSKSSVNIKKEVEITVTDTKKKLLDKLGVSEEDIIEGEFTED